MERFWINYLINKYALKQWQIENTYALYINEYTVPFIARYRKEKTGNLNETILFNLFKDFKNIEKIEKRKRNILESIEKQTKISNDLKQKIVNCTDEDLLEDLYLPFKPKKQTKASKAKQHGLEPLAWAILNNNAKINNSLLEKYTSNKYNTAEDVLNGVKEIIIEKITENAEIRNIVRKEFENNAVISSKVIKKKIKEAEKYKNYFDFQEKLNKCRAHRFLAMLRGKNEGFLRVSINIDNNKILKQITALFLTNQNLNIIKSCIEQSLYNNILPSIEKEFFKKYKQKADIESINIFANNLKQLLLAPPLLNKRILAIDPGYKTGCKIVCLDENGILLHNETIFPTPPVNDIKKSEKKIFSLVESYKIDCIALGDGTASREVEQFLSKIKFSKPIKIYVVSEAGASVYSVSDIARKEFPQYDVTVRSAISIGRRLQDPLAELVKIPPKSIGVGQYQHDVDEKLLEESLENTVIECVNKVGIKLNRANEHLLKYVSGIGKNIANAIVEYRKNNGPFKTKTDLLKVKGVNKKIFQLSAGFLRIENGTNILDNTGIHPDNYNVVEKIAKDLNVEIKMLFDKPELLDKIDKEKYITEDIGINTIDDIINEIKNPGYDVRLKVKVLEFSPNLKTFEDLKVGMVINGIITNITNFGAFVNVGIKESGLIHISEISDDYIESPLELLHIHQHVKVKVIRIDEKLRKFQLSMKNIENLT
jgi:uncharacterized protein